MTGRATRRRLGRLWREWLRSLLIMVLIITSFRSAVADWNDVPTGSMKPTILEGDRIVVNKLAYDLKLPFTMVRLLSWADPRRGDIVVLRSPSDGKRLVKRVVGLPGDEIALIRNRLFVNGAPMGYAMAIEAQAGATGTRELEGDRVARAATGSAPGRQRVVSEDLGRVSHQVLLTPHAFSPSTFGPIIVASGSYFVMGDNRDQSLDSRHFGFVPRRSIIGRATAVAASVDPSEHYVPRWSRFFQALR